MMRRISSFLFVLLLMLASFTAGLEYPRGDVDQNGQVNIADVVTLIDYLLTGTWEDSPVTPPDEPQTETFTVNGETFTMVAVEGGTFMMGATDEQGDDASSAETPVHEVTLSSFSIGQTEVTQELWQAVMNSNPSYIIGRHHPVEWVTWDDCQTFVAQLNTLTGKAFRLPTEAEWEFAARGGNRSQGYKCAGSNNIDDVAWYWYNIPSQEYGEPGFGTQPVATKLPNELGLYDMNGNVWEWCQDWFLDYVSSEAQINPTGPDTGHGRVIRGGSWRSGVSPLRVSARAFYSPTSMNTEIGLRLAL